ncbi:hypothetical protein H257_00223 [Aphanomyces astaci]|uniref:DAGKc domain-containing protein n=1 Tax=Aphanomyces astaci TaxID=112090 RepID=W4HC61_APHAT|nr:hypothetical protein H257_00223 [Aphanomyces astaci]ETV88703.1 hypothetical protein H257_00223 [Aphanomyces astaci]|eukprot:XP_009821103.1 hypothetical protein H257_00223 [Aphanomyces astaci]
MRLIWWTNPKAPEAKADSPLQKASMSFCNLARALPYQDDSEKGMAEQVNKVDNCNLMERPSKHHPAWSTSAKSSMDCSDRSINALSFSNARQLRSLFTADTHDTPQPDDAGYECVVLVGGDSTANEFVNGRLSRPEVEWRQFFVVATPLAFLSLKGATDTLSRHMQAALHVASIYATLTHKIRSLDVLAVESPPGTTSFACCGVAAAVPGDVRPSSGCGHRGKMPRPLAAAEPHHTEEEGSFAVVEGWTATAEVRHHSDGYMEFVAVRRGSLLGPAVTTWKAARGQVHPPATTRRVAPLQAHNGVVRIPVVRNLLAESTS